MGALALSHVFVVGLSVYFLGLDLMLVSYAGRTTDIKLIMALGISPNGLDGYGTPLGLAISNGQLPAVKLLIENGARKDSYNPSVRSIPFVSGPLRLRSTPLIVAAISKQDAIAAYLLSKGASPNGRWPQLGITAAGIAASHGDTQLLSLLIAYGADMNIGSRSGLTPLMLAAEHSDVSTVRLLLNHGANVLAVTNHGHTALWYALRSNRHDIAAVLRQAGERV